ncbi:hypothetical protein IKG64_02880 [Candidatus Saccharibacteria bacterium]|nr:hypothetical protein [Candidatus Saccharibacteria bacterium]
MEESNSHKKRRNSDRGLFVVLCILVVAIVGLVVGVVAVRLEHGNRGEEEVSMDESGGTLDFGEEIYEKAVSIMNSGDEDSLDKLKVYFDSLLADIDDFEKAFGVISVFVGVLIEYDRYNDALAVLDESYRDSLTDDQKITMYSYYSIVYSNLGDIKKSDEYSLKAQELIDKTQEDW